MFRETERHLMTFVRLTSFSLTEYDAYLRMRMNGVKSQLYVSKCGVFIDHTEYSDEHMVIVNRYFGPVMMSDCSCVRPNSVIEFSPDKNLSTI